MEITSLDPALHDWSFEILSGIPLFAGLTRSAYSKLADLIHLVQLDNNDVLVQSGHEPKYFYVLLSGEIAIYDEKPIKERILLGQMKGPCTIGEISLLLKKRHTATVVCSRPGQALQISSAAFIPMFNQVPGFGLQVAKVMAQRLVALSDSNRELTEARGEVVKKPQDVWGLAH